MRNDSVHIKASHSLQHDDDENNTIKNHHHSAMHPYLSQVHGSHVYLVAHENELCNVITGLHPNEFSVKPSQPLPLGVVMKFGRPQETYANISLWLNWADFVDAPSYKEASYWLHLLHQGSLTMATTKSMLASKEEYNPSTTFTFKSASHSSINMVHMSSIPNRLGPLNASLAKSSSSSSIRTTKSKRMGTRSNNNNKKQSALSLRPAIENFLDGPALSLKDDRTYKQECRDLLRKLSTIDTVF